MPTKKEKQPLSVTHPELAKEADGWNPSTLTFGSGKKVNWKCSRGHSYQTTVDKRTSRGHSCPYCSGHQVLAGFNDLATTHPEFAEQASKDHRLYAFFHIAAFTGARRGELLALRWSDFDGATLNISKSRVQAGSITVEEITTKGGDNGQRRVKLAIPERKLLEAHRLSQKAELERLGLPTPISNYIFTQPDGSPLYPSTPTALFRKVSEKLNIPTSNLHGLRHVHATALLRSGEPLHVVAQRLGHRDAMVTATIYAHV